MIADLFFVPEYLYRRKPGDKELETWRVRFQFWHSVREVLRIE